MVTVVQQSKRLLAGLDVKELPGFDAYLHASPVVDERVEEGPDGSHVVVYSVSRDIVEEAQLRRERMSPAN